MNLSLTKKILLSVLGLGVVGSLVGMGTFASFTAQVQNTSNTFSTGTLALDSIQAGSSVANNSFISLSSIKPGDSKTTLLEIKNTGSLNLQNLQLATTISTASNLLTSNAANGLQLEIKRCTAAYTGSGTTATCAATESTVRASAAILQSATSIDSTTLAGGASNYYKITVSLPTSADNNYQNLSATIVFTWTGEQVAGSAS